MNDVNATRNETPGGTRPATGWAATTAIILCTLAACVVLLEMGLRVIGRYPINSLQGYFAQGSIAYRLRPNVSRTIKWPTTTFTVNTDEMGFRARRPGPRGLDSRPYYAVLGSSDVFGNGLDYEKTFIGVFAEKMERHGIEVVNMAVGGHGLDEQTSIFEDHAASVKDPPRVLLICLNPLVISLYDDRHEGVVVRNGNLFPKDNWKMAYVRMVLQNKSTVYCFFRDSIRHIQLRYFDRQDFDMSFYFDLYSQMNPIRTSTRMGDFLGRLADFEKDIRSLKARPVYVYCPFPAGFDLNRPELDTQFFPVLIDQHCKAEGIQFINLEPALTQLHDKGQKLNIDLDGHFNGPTSRVIGEHLYESLKPGGNTE